MSFADDLRQRTGPLWSAILAHPFVTGIGDGTLSRDRFKFYLQQDYVYLIDFGRVLALASAKAESLPEMNHFSALLQLMLNTEMELHRRVCAEYGIGPAELERTEAAFITSSYTNTLLRYCYEGTMADILAALLPCAAGYVEIAAHLTHRGLPDHPHYRDWIETYASREMKEAADWLRAHLDHLACDRSTEQLDRWFRVYRASARFELLFFEMGWTRMLWPDCVPR